MKKSEFEVFLRAARREEFTLLTREALSLVPAGSEAEALLAEEGFVPDEGTAYFRFHVCHSLPNYAGPALRGGVTGIHPQVLWKSHHRLRHKHLNLDHRMHAYDPERTPYDRIIGCHLTSAFPDPAGGRYSGAAWEIPDAAEAAPCITGVAAVFKAAKGVSKFLGDHLSGTRTHSVSIEMSCAFEEMGIYRPTTRELYLVDEAPEPFLEALGQGPTGGIELGATRDGEQLVWAMAGRDGRLMFKGQAVTATPAERTAGIGQVLAGATSGEDDEAALRGDGKEEGEGEGEDGARDPIAPGDVVLLDEGKEATVLSVAEDGLAALPGKLIFRRGTPDDPAYVLRVHSTGAMVVCGSARIRPAGGMTKTE